MTLLGRALDAGYQLREISAEPDLVKLRADPDTTGSPRVTKSSFWSELGAQASAHHSPNAPAEHPGQSSCSIPDCFRASPRVREQTAEARGPRHGLEPLGFRGSQAPACLGNAR